VRATGGRKDKAPSERGDGAAHPGGAARDNTKPQNRKRGGRFGGPRGNNNGQRGNPQGGLRQANPAGGSQPTGRGSKNRQDIGDDLPRGAAQPDPMKTAFGYIGVDSFTRQRQDAGQRPRGGQRRGGGRGK